MGIINHINYILDPQSGTDFLDRIIVGQKIAVPITATTGTVYPISFIDPLPANYMVVVTPSVDIIKPAFVSGKTSTGFNVTLPGAVPGAGTMDILVYSA
jgi:hypothetical protein